MDNSIFIEIKNKKRVIHNRSPLLAARTTLEELPDFVPIEEYNLQDHINYLYKSVNEADSYEL